MNKFFTNHILKWAVSVNINCTCDFFSLLFVKYIYKIQTKR
jgi:hypothetical protein